MKINHNIIAQLANVNLKKDERSMSASIEKLSSGYKIIRAADDAAGMAISNKMRTQIRALDQAARNAADGQSIVQTADGALNEVTGILQRMRELSVQAANDTYTLEDRAAAQAEVDEPLDEIDRISTTTEFNGKKLLDGSISRTFTSDNAGVDAVSASMDVPSGDYEITVDELPEPASVPINLDLPVTEDSSIIINGTRVEITPLDDVDSVAEKVIEVCDKMNIDVTLNANVLTLTTRATGYNQMIEVEDQKGSKLLDRGENAKITPGSNFNPSAKVFVDGGHVKIKDNNGFEMLVEIPEEIEYLDPDTGLLQVDPPIPIKFTVYDAGYMGMQIGANEDQTLAMNFAEVSCRTLMLRDSDGQNVVNLCTQHNASLAITSFDEAINMVSSTRSLLGAYQNRLASTESSLDVSSYNMTDAMSHIMDTDVAEEMTQYTQFSVLQQAATAMLSQANNKPQEVMNIIQGI